MAKLRGAAKEAFKRRMARGRRKAALAKSHGRRRRRSNPAMTKIIAANPSRKRRRSSAKSVRRRRPRRATLVSRVTAVPMSLVRNLLKGATSMATKRRKSKRRRRSNPSALLVNPRRRRHKRRNPRRRSHRRRRRNPGNIGNLIRGGLSSVALAAIPATLGAFAFSFLDAKFLGPAGTVVRNVAKVIFAGMLGTMGRNWLGKDGSLVAMGAVLGTIGAEFGVKAAGGLVAMNPAESLKELVLQAANDGEMQQQLGALIEGGGLGGTAANDFDKAMEGEIPADYAAALTGQGFQGEGMF
jgi:hypothetical protein